MTPGGEADAAQQRVAGIDGLEAAQQGVERLLRLLGGAHALRIALE